MINGLGVVGWGVGGIEAEAAMLGQPISMLIPAVLGFRLTGAMLEGATATDLVLTITERLRKHGVVGKFVEFFGPGLEHLTIADRATLGNMCPEYGATIAIFPIDEMTLDYLRLTGRDESHVQLVEAYAKAQGLFRQAGDADPMYSETIELDLGDGRAQPGRPAPAAGSRIAQAGEERLQHGAADPAGRVREERRDGRRVGRRVGEERRRGGGRSAGRHWDRSRRGRDCGDHELHQHVESERDDRRRPAREESGRARPDAQAVGEDQPGARLEGRDRVPAEGRPQHLPRSARLQPGRLRLHHLHRQQRSAAGGCLGRGRGPQPGGRVGPQRQPQLRGPDPAAGARQLPGVAAARRRVCACRLDDDGPDDGAARHRQRRHSRCICATSGRPSARFRRRCCVR